jgi:hypothetical protein
MKDADKWVSHGELEKHRFKSLRNILMNTRFASSGRNLRFSGGKTVSTPLADTLSPPALSRPYATVTSETTIVDLLDLLDPLARPITASREVYADGGGI